LSKLFRRFVLNLKKANRIYFLKSLTFGGKVVLFLSWSRASNNRPWTAPGVTVTSEISSSVTRNGWPLTPKSPVSLVSDRHEVQRTPIRQKRPGQHADPVPDPACGPECPGRAPVAGGAPVDPQPSPGLSDQRRHEREAMLENQWEEGQRMQQIVRLTDLDRIRAPHGRCRAGLGPNIVPGRPETLVRPQLSHYCTRVGSGNDAGCVG